MRGRFDPGVEDEQWCARRLLARIHAYTQHRLRREIEPVTAQELMRFLLQLAARRPRTPTPGAGRGAGRHRPAPGVRDPRRRVGGGRPSGAGGGIPAPLARGPLPRRASSSGAVSPRDRPTPRAPSAGARPHPSRATPVTFALREDLPWLLQAARGRRGAVRSRPTARRATCSTPCVAAGPCSTRSCAPPPVASRSRWRKDCGTWWRGASSPPTASRPCAPCSRPARRGSGASATSSDSVPGRAGRPRGARAARAGGRCCPSGGPDEDDRQRDTGRTGGRTAPGPMGRRLLGSHGAREPGPAVARGGMGAAPPRGPRPRARRPLRDGSGRRAVRTARGGRGAASRPADADAAGRPFD